MHFIQRRSSKALRSHWLEIGVRRGDVRVHQRKHVLVKATLQDAGGVRISNCMGVRGEHGHGQNRSTASNGSTEIISSSDRLRARRRGAYLPVSEILMWCSAVGCNRRRPLA
ncbi:SUVZ05G0635 [Saccharomyces uvarum]|uniref:SUVZ05G0635 protein n=1 Tax=Saccharomyces uvarum TaxID=230603 RepID=A0ABN8WS38_SACUV|nr:SUVZ05G0635 [Saccharomyces uvarum]